MVSPPVAVFVLGPPRVTIAGRRVELPDQLMRVLVALALTTEPVDKARLAHDVLFLSPRTIDSRLSRLSRALGLVRPVHRVPVARSGMIELDRSTVTVDADGFRALLSEAQTARDAGDETRALQLLFQADDLWGGPPPDELGSQNRDPTTGVGRAISDLITLRVGLCSLAAELMLTFSTSDRTRLIRWAHEHPELQHVWFAYVVATFDAEGPIAANRVLDEWRTIAVPERQQLTRSWAMELARAGYPGYADEFLESRTHPQPTPHVVRAELTSQLDALVANRSGAPAVLGVITGPEGSGKTQLLHYVATSASTHGAFVIRVNASEAQDFHRIVQALLVPLWQRELRRPDPAPDVARRSAGLASLLSITAERRDDTPRRVPVDPTRHAAVLGGALLRSAVRRGRVVLLVDNFDAAGPQLQQFVLRLHREGINGVTTIVTSRHSALHAPATAGQRDGHIVHLALGPLDLHEASRLLTEARGITLSREAIGSLLSRVGATPRAVLTADTDESLPVARLADDSLRRALRLLPKDTRRALAVAAVAADGADGAEYDERLLDALLPGAVEHLGREGLTPGITDDRIPFADRAGLDVAYSMLDPLDRRRLHTSVLEVLDAWIEREDDLTRLGHLAVQLAHHARRSDLSTISRARSLRALTRAAESLASIDPARALDLYGHAMSIAVDSSERSDLLLHRARLHWHSSNWDTAERDATEALGLAEANGHPPTAAEALLLLAQLTWDPMRGGGSLAHRLNELLKQIPIEERLLRARMQACLAGGLYQDGTSTTDSSMLARSALAALDSLEVSPDPSSEAEILWWARKGLLDIEAPAATAKLSSRMRVTADVSGSLHHLGNAMLASVVDHLSLARIRAAHGASREYTNLASTTTSTMQRYVAATLEGLWALYYGRFEAVVTATCSAETLGAAFGGITMTQVVEGQRVFMARDLGDFRSRPELVELVEALTPIDGPIPIWAGASAWLRADIGDDAAALDRVESIAAVTGGLASITPGPHRLPLLAFLAETLSEVQARATTSPAPVRPFAERVYNQLASHPARGVLLGWPVAYLGTKERYLGLAAAAAGSLDAAVTHLERAARSDRATSPTGIRTRLALARVFASQGERDRARHFAVSCARRAAALKMQGVASDARSLLGCL